MSDDPLKALKSFVDPPNRDDDARDCHERLMDRILVLSDYAWERRIDKRSVEDWLANFDGRSGQDIDVEQLHALYLLSQFLYFGVREIRVLLQALYRDLYLIPLIQEVRKKLGGTRDSVSIDAALTAELKATRFLGVGNPSESGVHLLYYFRQENKLTKKHFLDTAEIFKVDGATRSVRDKAIGRYVFLDDVCGSGDTAVDYSRNFLEELRRQRPKAHIAYHAIFATADGLKNVRENSVFGEHAKAVFTLDESYRSLSSKSRYFKLRPDPIDCALLTKVGLHYGKLLAPRHPGGFNNDQLLLGFSHNIPDNTLPIIWRDPTNGAPIPWTAALRRYMKV